MKTLRTGLLAVALTLPVGVPAQAQTGNDLFQQALVMEQAEGNLQAAIQLYERIVAEFGGDRPLAARALVQIGRCYEKLGSQEAERAYRRVVSDYADQSEHVEEARSRLQALIQPPPAAAPSEIRVRRIMGGHYPDEVDMEGGPTPDGKSLLYVDYETGNFGVRNLVSGESKIITDNNYEDGYPGYGIVSPDGRLVAYDWHHTQPDEGAFGISGTELRVVGIDGSNPRTLYTQWIVYPGSWSQDGRHIAVIIHRSEDAVTEIARISVEDGSKATLWTFDYGARFFTDLSHSPDSRFVAVGFPVEEDSAQLDISLLATDGSGIRPLVDHPADDRLIGWVPGTEDVLFVSDRSGDYDLWAVSVNEDGSHGQPRPVRRGIGEMDPMGFTQDGSLFYSNYTLQYNISLAPFDEASGESRMEESEALGGLGSNMAPSWSPNGEHLAFVRRRPSPPGRGFGMKGFEEIIHVRNLETGEERALAEHIAPATTGAPVWFPDGKSLLVLGMPQESSGGLDWGNVPSVVYRVDMETGEASPLFEFPPDDGWWSRIGIIPTSDGRGVIYSRDGRLVRRDLDSGREVELYKDPELGTAIISLSPDGSELVFGVNDPAQPTLYVDPRIHEGGRLMIIPSNGGDTRELFKLDRTGRVGGVLWSSDGSTIFFSVRNEDGTTFLRGDRGGGEVERIQEFPTRPAGFRLSPDGRRIAYWIQENEAEIWVMENLLAALRETEGRR